ncbi:MAG: cyclohydrolase, partial [Actinomycetota bacterium]|nr:cyclohydrolase [Actinomycetota bacterium]
MDRDLLIESVRSILKGIGEEPDREGLVRTPERVADMYAELFSGIGKDPRDELQVVFEEGHDEMVMVKDIPLGSICEHHLFPFFGRAHVA